MGEIILLDDHRPHAVVCAGNDAYVTPVSVFRQIINGEMSMFELEDCEIIIPAIIGEWLEIIVEKGD